MRKNPDENVTKEAVEPDAAVSQPVRPQKDTKKGPVSQPVSKEQNKTEENKDQKETEEDAKPPPPTPPANPYVLNEGENKWVAALQPEDQKRFNESLVKLNSGYWALGPNPDKKPEELVVLSFRSPGDVKIGRMNGKIQGPPGEPVMEMQMRMMVGSGFC